MQTLFRLSLLTAVMGGAAFPAKAGIITSNFGEPGDTYQTSTGTAWAIGAATNESMAVSFTIPVGFTYRLTQFRVADNWFAGTNSLPVGIYSGSDPTTATLLESFTLVASAMQTAQIFTETSVLQPLLQSGQTYLIEELSPASCPPSPTAPACATDWGWQWNNNASLTGHYTLDNNSGGWSFRSASIIPVFDVSGTPVPEPGSVIFVGAVLLALIILRR